MTDRKRDFDPALSPAELHEKIQTFLGLMTLANGSFGEFLDWLSTYVTLSLLDPEKIIAELDGDIITAQEFVQDKAAQAMADMPTAGGVH
jgi:hypothetical protein